MMYHNIDFDTYFKNYPDAKGYFGKYGGSFISPELQTAMNEISEAYQAICKSGQFICELSVFVKNFRVDPHRFHIWRDYQIRLEREFNFM